MDQSAFQHNASSVQYRNESEGYSSILTGYGWNGMEFSQSVNNVPSQIEPVYGVGCGQIVNNAPSHIGPLHCMGCSQIVNSAPRQVGHVYGVGYGQIVTNAPTQLGSVDNQQACFNLDPHSSLTRAPNTSYALFSGFEQSSIIGPSPSAVDANGQSPTPGNRFQQNILFWPLSKSTVELTPSTQSYAGFNRSLKHGRCINTYNLRPLVPVLLDYIHNSPMGSGAHIDAGHG